MNVDTTQITEVARGISDFGLSVIIAAVFLIISSGLMISCFAWFKSIINGIIDRNEKLMQELLTETRTLRRKLSPLSEAAQSETLLRMKDTADVYFDLAIEKVCRLIKRIREENHIADKENTALKIRRLLHNIYEERNNSFDNYTYRGRKLSSYTNPEWVEQVAVTVEAELYHEAGPNNSRAYTNIKAVYDDIRNDFYYRLNN